MQDVSAVQVFDTTDAKSSGGATDGHGPSWFAREHSHADTSSRDPRGPSSGSGSAERKLSAYVAPLTVTPPGQVVVAAQVRAPDAELLGLIARPPASVSTMALRAYQESGVRPAPIVIELALSSVNQKA
ncbi:hypothetical protein ACFQ4E_13445 [Litorisediminicola beolgyonensis]|uniref:Uncharacterized protein n=1 Tax=Litorisediminicola beolgyonensis TaxID=1173614 RepID=A0ABW3ZLA7_9RHOB